MTAFNTPNTDTPLHWVLKDHVAGKQDPSTEDPFPGARLEGNKLVDADGNALLGFYEVENPVENFTLAIAKQIAQAVLSRVSAW